MAHQKAIIVGISGCSSSGKTTLARLLRDIFPNTFILHEDDFYKAEDQLPIKDGLVDWDCPEAISIPDMEKALTHIRSTGTFPPEVDSKEDQNSVGESPVTPAQIAAARQKVQDWLQPGQPGSRIFPLKSSQPHKDQQGENNHHHNSSPHREPERTGPRICLLDGFLLYSPTHLPEKIMTTLLDIKLFMLVSRQKATQRREARDGYVTLEGFWTDPPGYVEKIVWPNYVEAHRWLFEGGDVERGVLNREVMEKYGVLAQTDKGLDVPFGETLDWAVEMIQKELERIVLGEGEGKGEDGK